MTFYIVGRTGTQVENIAQLIKNVHGEEHTIIPTYDANCISFKQEGERDTFFVYVKIPTTVAWDRVVTPKDENGRLISPVINDFMQSKFVDDQIVFVNGRFEHLADYTIDENDMLINTANDIWEYIRKCAEE